MSKVGRISEAWSDEARQAAAEARRRYPVPANPDHGWFKKRCPDCGAPAGRACVIKSSGKPYPLLAHGARLITAHRGKR